MGNKLLLKQDDKFEQMIKKIKHQQHSMQYSQKITINPQQKYLSIMIDKLSVATLPQQLKNRLSTTLHQKLSKQQLIKTISIANVLKNNEFDIILSKNSLINKQSTSKKVKSKNVKLNYNKINPYIKKNLDKNKSEFFIGKEEQYFAEHNTSSSQENSIKYSEILNKQQELQHQNTKQQQAKFIKQDKDNQMRGNIDLAIKILRNQLKKMYHPFWKLNKVFSDFLTHDFIAILDRKSEQKNSKFAQPSARSRYQQILNKLLNSWCSYLQQGCLYPYKSWLITFLQLPGPKLQKVLTSCLLQQIFVINNSYLYHTCMLLIENLSPIPGIPICVIRQQLNLITPELFSINKQLQIQGAYVMSLYQLSQLENVYKPQDILQYLSMIKNSICNDVDQYHKLAEKKQFYQIDSDNILGIVSYLLTRIPEKISAIHKIMALLNIVYGDNVFFTFGISSYMISTICGSLEFLQGQDFFRLIKQNPLKNKTPFSPPTQTKTHQITQLCKQQSNKQTDHTRQTFQVSLNESIKSNPRLNE